MADLVPCVASVANVANVASVAEVVPVPSWLIPTSEFLKPDDGREKKLGSAKYRFKKTHVGSLIDLGQAQWLSGVSHLFKIEN